jgi:hypothetical protein
MEEIDTLIKPFIVGSKISTKTRIRVGNVYIRAIDYIWIYYQSLRGLSETSVSCIFCKKFEPVDIPISILNISVRVVRLSLDTSISIFPNWLTFSRLNTVSYIHSKNVGKSQK